MEEFIKKISLPTSEPHPPIEAEKLIPIINPLINLFDSLVSDISSSSTSMVFDLFSSSAAAIYFCKYTLN